MTNTEHPHEVARFYTRARKFPKLIGRLHDGTRIPGGPYTVSQLVTLVTLTTLAMITRGWWGGAILFDIVIALAIGVGGALLLGMLPAQQRNLFSVAAGIIRATTTPASGHYNGQTIRLTPPHHARGRVAINTPPAPELAATEPIEEHPRPAPQAAPAARTGVERLLLQTKK